MLAIAHSHVKFTDKAALVRGEAYYCYVLNATVHAVTTLSSCAHYVLPVNEKSTTEAIQET